MWMGMLVMWIVIICVLMFIIKCAADKSAVIQQKNDQLSKQLIEARDNNDITSN